MESSSWQWPKGVVAGAIPNSYYPMPAIEDEVEDFFNDKELQSTVKKSTMEEYLREAHSRLYEHAGGFKSAYVAVGALGRFKGTIVEMEKGETGEGEGSKTEEEGETGRGKDEGGRGLDGAPLGAPVVPVTRKRQLKVSVRLCNSSSRTNVIDYRQIDSKVKQMVIPHVSNFLQRQPTFVARATFPRFLREDIGDRPDGNNFQLESFSKYNNVTMKNDGDVFGSSIVWCEHKNKMKSKKHASSLADPSRNAPGHQKQVIDSVHGLVLKDKEHKRPSEVKVVIKVSGSLILGHADDDEADLNRTNFQHGAHNAMIMVDIPKCVKNLVTKMRSADGQSFPTISPPKAVGGESPGEREELGREVEAEHEEEQEQEQQEDGEQEEKNGRRKSRRTTRNVNVFPSSPDTPPPAPKKYKDGFVEPLIQHIPLLDGPLRTVCLKPGNLSTKPINFNLSLVPPSTYEDPDVLSVQDSYICAVCSSSDTELKMYKCFLCGLTVHLDCCFDAGMMTGSGKRKRWICCVCNVAKTKSASPHSELPSSQSPTSTPQSDQSISAPRPVRTARLFKNSNAKDMNSPDTSAEISSNWERPLHPCLMCHHLGGAMSPTTDNQWVHEVCRVFCYGVERRSSTCDRERCALCGLWECTEDPNAIIKRRLVRCCAKDCAVVFHPICAQTYNRKVIPATEELVRQEGLVHAEMMKIKEQDGKEEGIEIKKMQRNAKERLERLEKRLASEQTQRKLDKKDLFNFRRRKYYKPGTEKDEFSDAVINDEPLPSAALVEAEKQNPFLKRDKKFGVHFKTELEKDGFDEDEWFRMRVDDMLVTSEYSLRIGICQTSDGNNKKDRNDLVFPLVYCPMHHPARSRQFNGFPPGPCRDENPFDTPRRAPPPAANEAVELWKTNFERSEATKEERRQAKEGERKKEEEIRQKRLEELKEKRLEKKRQREEEEEEDDEELDYGDDDENDEIPEGWGETEVEVGGMGRR